jgi:hypothetical protein
MKASRMCWVALVLAMTIQSAWAFYNPQTRRWLNRDPLGEVGGENLYSFVDNNAIDRQDRLGLHYDFKWDLPRIWTVPKPLEEVRGRYLYKYYGLTGWDYFRPKAKVWRLHPEDCLYQIYVSGQARVWSWYVKGQEDAKEHEMEHVNVHYKGAYSSFGDYARPLVDLPMPKARAECYKRVIEGIMRETFMTQARADAQWFDCHDYGHPENPGDEVCDNARRWREQYFRLFQRLLLSLEECSKIEGCQ